MSWPGVEQWLGTPHERELLPMSVRQVQELLQHGWEAGSHTRTHPRLSELDDAAILPELERSRAECEALTGMPCTSLAYPYGDFDERVTAATEQAGYRAAGTLSSRFNTGLALEWPRVGVYNRDTERRFRVKVSPTIRRVRSTRLWDVANEARWKLRGLR
jgi:peptidoglycan/xylan/chitin deacetylase (PgdA/CDA1 family)